MAYFLNALKAFLLQRCRVQSTSTEEAGDCYVMDVAEGRHFMTQSHTREMLRVIHQIGEGAMSIKPSPVENRIEILARQEPDGGVSEIRIPAVLLNSLDSKQAFLILRNLRNIAEDIDQGRHYKKRLEMLFQQTAVVRLVNSEKGERWFDITGKFSHDMKRRYIERYAEQVAAHTLFDVAKALNTRLEHFLPPEKRDKYFQEGRDFSDRKIRYGDAVGTELMLSDEGAEAYIGLIDENPELTEPLSKLLQKTMLDPFGLSIRHYMGKHNVLKAGKRPLVRIPPLSGFLGWLKGLFNRHPREP